VCIYGLAGTTPCPLYQDNTIVQQPANFLALSETYSTAATNFIHEMAGMYVYIYCYTHVIHAVMHSTIQNIKLNAHIWQDHIW